MKSGRSVRRVIEMQMVEENHRRLACPHLTNGDSILVDLEESLDDGDKVRRSCSNAAGAKPADNPEKV